MHKLILQQKTPSEKGEIHGESFREEINELCEIRLGLFHKFMASWSGDQIDELCQKQIMRLQSESDLYEEFQSLARAANLSENHLMILNNYTDMRDFSGEDQAPMEDGCSLFSIRSEGLSYHGQTWDMHASAMPYVLWMQNQDPEPTHVLTVVGCLGLAGLNPNGLGVYINNMHCREINGEGLMWPALVRKMLAQNSAEGAAKILPTNLPASGHNYLLTDFSQTYDFETTGTRFEEIASFRDRGLTFHTNHYVGKLAEAEIIERQSPSTHKRYAAIQDFFEENAIDSLKLSTVHQNFLKDGPVCREINLPPKESDPHAGATCGGLLVDYQNRQAEIFSKIYGEGETHKFQF